MDAFKDEWAFHKADDWLANYALNLFLNTCVHLCLFVHFSSSVSNSRSRLKDGFCTAIKQNKILLYGKICFLSCLTPHLAVGITYSIYWLMFCRWFLTMFHILIFRSDVFDWMVEVDVVSDSTWSRIVIIFLLFFFLSRSFSSRWHLICRKSPAYGNTQKSFSSSVILIFLPVKTYNPEELLTLSMEPVAAAAPPHGFKMTQ